MAETKDKPAKTPAPKAESKPKAEGNDKGDKGDKAEPKHLTAKVDENILKLLVGKPVKKAEPEAATSQPVPNPPPKPKK